MSLSFIPEEARPREVAILTFYYVLGVTDAKEIARLLHYDDSSTVYRVLKRFRGKITVDRGAVTVQSFAFPQGITL